MGKFWNRPHVKATAAVIGIGVMVGAIVMSPANASVSTQLQTAQDTLANCRLLSNNSTTAQRIRAQECITDQLRIIQLLGGSATPTPTATPTQPPSGWPDATNTGVPAGTVLRSTNGRTITVAGTVVNGEDITGCLTINADNVTVRNTRIRCGGSPIRALQRTGILIEDVEVDCLNTDGTGIAGNFTARRVNAHACENGASLDGRNLVEDSYIHHLFERANPLGHTDGLQIPFSGDDIVIRGNWIENRTPNATSAIIADKPGTDRLTVDHNRLIGGGFVLRCPNPGVDNVITNNAISRGGYDHWIYCTDESVVSGNQLL